MFSSPCHCVCEIHNNTYPPYLTSTRRSSGENVPVKRGFDRDVYQPTKMQYIYECMSCSSCNPFCHSYNGIRNYTWKRCGTCFSIFLTFLDKYMQVSFLFPLCMSMLVQMNNYSISPACCGIDSCKLDTDWSSRAYKSCYWWVLTSPSSWYMCVCELSCFYWSYCIGFNLLFHLDFFFF